MVKALRNSKSDSKGDEEKLELTVGDITSLIEQPCPDEPEEEDLSAIAETIFTMPAVGRYQRPPRIENQTLAFPLRGSVANAVPQIGNSVSLPNNNMLQNSEDGSQSASNNVLSEGIPNETSSIRSPEPIAGPSDQSGHESAEMNTGLGPNDSNNLQLLCNSESQMDDSAICDMNAEISLTMSAVSTSHSSSQGESQNSGETLPTNLPDTGLTEEVLFSTNEQNSGVPSSFASGEIQSS